jgi:hypothetical protein
MGRAADMDGVWMDPVTAQEIITLFELRTRFPFREGLLKPTGVRLSCLATVVSARVALSSIARVTGV